MTEQEASVQAQKTNEAKEKRTYKSPVIIAFVSLKDTKGGTVGVSEHICGCGIGS